MAAAAGIFNPQTAAGQALAGGVPKPMNSTTTGTGGTGSSSSANGNSATISANDFLTLLVTEMQNQDPTATTDPNEYINQLVQVNSLEQLISINQTLSGALSGPPTASASGASGQAASAGSPLLDSGSTSAMKTVNTNAQNGSAFSSTPAAIAASHAPRFAAVAGNLSIPAANPAAARVASALEGRTGAPPIAASAAGMR